MGLVLAVLLIPGKIMAEECPLSAPLTLTDTQSGVAGETGTVWTIMPDCSFTVARHFGAKVLEPHKRGRLTPQQQAQLKDIVDRMGHMAGAPMPAAPPRANPRRIALSYGSQKAAVTLPPGGGNLVGLRALPEDEQVKRLLDLAAAVKSVLGN